MRYVSDCDSAPQHCQQETSQETQDYTQYSPVPDTGTEQVPDTGTEHVPDTGTEHVPGCSGTDYVPGEDIVPGTDHCQGSFQNKVKSSSKEEEASCWFDNAGLEVEGD